MSAAAPVLLQFRRPPGPAPAPGLCPVCNGPLGINPALVQAGDSWERICGVCFERVEVWLTELGKRRIRRFVSSGAGL